MSIRIDSEEAHLKRKASAERISKEIADLNRDLSLARRAAAKTGVYADRKWYTMAEHRIAMLKREQVSIQLEAEAARAARKKQFLDEQAGLYVAMCRVIEEHLGKVALLDLMAKAHALVIDWKDGKRCPPRKC